MNLIFGKTKKETWEGEIIDTVTNKKYFVIYVSTTGNITVTDLETNEPITDGDIFNAICLKF
jgi:hypothetical protein